MVTEKKEHSFMSQKMIVDKSSNMISEFVVFSKPTFKDTDWFLKPKLVEIIANKGDKKVVHHILKQTVKANRDDGKKPQDGKAIKITISDSNVSITYYSDSAQLKDEKWRSTHTHTIDKKVFDAYILVMQSDITVSEKEKEQKFLENSSLQLD